MRCRLSGKITSKPLTPETMRVVVCSLRERLRIFPDLIIPSQAQGGKRIRLWMRDKYDAVIDSLQHPAPNMSQVIIDPSGRYHLFINGREICSREHGRTWKHIRPSELFVFAYAAFKPGLISVKEFNAAWESMNIPMNKRGSLKSRVSSMRKQLRPVGLTMKESSPGRGKKMILEILTYPKLRPI